VTIRVDSITLCDEQPVRRYLGKTSSMPASASAGSVCPELNTTASAGALPPYLPIFVVSGIWTRSST
jgi:hypothetical protein